MSNGKVLFYESRGRKTVRYVSDTTIYEECLQNGRYVRLYWSSSGQVQRENVTEGLPSRDLIFSRKEYDPLKFPLNTFKLEIDGQTLHNQWEWAGGTIRPGERSGTQEAVVSLVHKIRPVEAKVITCLDGSSVITRRIEITNTGKSPAALSNVSVMSGMLWDNEYCDTLPFDGSKNAAYSLGFFQSQMNGEEGSFIWRPLDCETLCIEKSRGNMFYSPYFIVRNNVNGECFFIALAWSENFRAEFSFDRFQSTLSFGMGPYGPAPLRVIAPGETVSSPKVHIGPLRGNTDAMVEKWYGHLRRSVIPQHPSGTKVFTIAGRVVEEPGDWILREIDIAAEMGVEAFMMDAGWYGDEFGAWWKLRGDWNEGDFLPEGGVKGICKYVHAKGMLFGIWMEPECLMPESRTCKAHPEWRLVSDLDGRTDRYPLIDLADEQAAQHVERVIMHVIGDYGIDFYKTDYNQRVPEGGLHMRDGYAENEAWRHYEAIYGIYDRVLKAFPQMMLESCSAGGGRLDLGIMSRFHYGCQSDFSYFPRSIRAINALTLFLPPEALCYYHNHFSFAHELADIDTHLRVTLFARPIFVGFGAQNAEREGAYFSKTRQYIELAKGFCRPVMAGSPKVFHHTPFIGLTDPAEWCVLEYASQDRTIGYAGIFRLGCSRENDEYALKLRGLDLSYSYVVTCANSGSQFIASGAELAGRGLSVRLENANTSELILYRKA